MTVLDKYLEMLTFNLNIGLLLKPTPVSYKYLKITLLLTYRRKCH